MALALSGAAAQELAKEGIAAATLLAVDQYIAGQDPYNPNLRGTKRKYTAYGPQPRWVRQRLNPTLNPVEHQSLSHINEMPYLRKRKRTKHTKMRRRQRPRTARPGRGVMVSKGGFNKYERFQITGEGLWTYPSAAFRVRMGTLNVKKLPLPLIGGGHQNYNRRSKDITVKGWDIHRQFYASETIGNSAAATVTTYYGPMMVHWAIVQFNCAPPTDEDAFNRLSEQFFVDYQTEDRQYRPFLPMSVDAVAGEIHDMWKVDGKMFKHAQWRILKRKKKLIFPNLETGNGWNKDFTMWNMKTWFKFNGKVHLDDVTNDSWDHPCYEVFWYVPLSPTRLTNFPATGGTHPTPLSTCERRIVVFKDSQT